MGLETKPVSGVTTYLAQLVGPVRVVAPTALVQVPVSPRVKRGNAFICFCLVFYYTQTPEELQQVPTPLEQLQHIKKVQTNKTEAADEGKDKTKADAQGSPGKGRRKNRMFVGNDPVDKHI